MKETHPMTAEVSHPGYSQSSPSKYMEVGMYICTVYTHAYTINYKDKLQCV